MMIRAMRPGRPTATPNRGRAEELAQARVVRWTHLRAVRDVLPVLAFIHHSPNGGRRDGFTGAQMKALGTSPGFPDLILPAPGTDPNGRPRVGLAVEMKAPGGRLAEAQAGWLLHLESAGWHTQVVWSAEEARDTIAAFLGAQPGQLPDMP